MSGASTFFTNEILVFRLDGYSYYDNSFVYEFTSQSDGQVKTWWLHEDDAAASFEAFFELIDA